LDKKAHFNHVFGDFAEIGRLIALVLRLLNPTRSRWNWVRCLSAVLAAFSLPVALAGCGGSSSPEHRDSEQAARKFDAADLPSLNECLAKIGSTLEKRGGQEQLGISCAVATYVGRTPDGYDCSLKVDNDPAEVRMQVGRDREIDSHRGLGLQCGGATDPERPGRQFPRAAWNSGHALHAGHRGRLHDRDPEFADEWRSTELAYHGLFDYYQLPVPVRLQLRPLSIRSLAGREFITQE
jgi:hypothetical protein